MKEENMIIAGHIPATLYGDKSDKLFLFVHGLGGNRLEAGSFAPLAAGKGWQVLSIDLPEHGDRRDDAKLLPWVAIPELQAVMTLLQDKWQHIAIRAISIGAWLSMLAFSGKPIEKCLLVSPVVDMENMICHMLGMSGVSEEQLQREKEIPTPFGAVLSWDYLVYAREHPAAALCPDTAILYGEHDVLVPRPVIDNFTALNNCCLTVMPGGEHWFHTPEQLAFMGDWELEHI